MKKTFVEYKLQYLCLMQDFIDDITAPENFIEEFYKTWHADNKEMRKENFKFEEENYTKFSHLMSEMFIDCDLFDPYPENESEINEIELKRRVEIALLEARLL